MIRNVILGSVSTAMLLVCATSSSAQSTERTGIEETRSGAVNGQASIAENAAKWGLSTEEYARYETAMSGLRGRLSDTSITPIEVLGIEARTEAERRKYAEAWVRMIEADTAKVLEFSNAVNTAWGRLHPGAPVINSDRINALRAGTDSRYDPIAKSTDSILLSGRLLLFTKLDCERCEAEAGAIISRAVSGEFRGVDVYFIDASRSNGGEIQTWARKIGVPQSAVRARRVTLNFDGGAFERLTSALSFTPGTFPAVFHRRGEDDYEYVRVD